MKKTSSQCNGVNVAVSGNLLDDELYYSRASEIAMMATSAEIKGGKERSK